MLNQTHINHLAIILDGNRRFASRLLRKPWEGHKYGLFKARQALQWTCEYGIKYMTTYILSIENLYNRPKHEIKYLFKYLEKEADTILKGKSHLVHKNKIAVRFIGRLWLLPETLQKKISKVENLTKAYKNHVLNVAVAYGGQQEIVDAVKQIVEKVTKGLLPISQLNDDIVKNHLYTNGQPLPDAILRTGGQTRMSNFLLYQGAYAELIVLNKLWPEITKEDFVGALEEFEARRRNFGS